MSDALGLRYGANTPWRNFKDCAYPCRNESQNAMAGCRAGAFPMASRPVWPREREDLVTIPPPLEPGRSGLVVPHRPGWFLRLASVLAYAVERLLTTTLRYEWLDASGLQNSAMSRPVIFCLWHNRLALSMAVHRKYPGKLAALISASKDGALLMAVLARHGVLAVRGSSSRRGPQALLELVSQAERGYDLAITPDGPRGPRYVVQEGVISLAQVTGLAIVPVTCNISRKICVKSWDRFQIPLPFARCEMVLKHPIRVPRDASAAGREELRATLENSLCSSSRD